MGRARIRAILAALRRPWAWGLRRVAPALLLPSVLTGLLLVGLLWSDATALPAAAAWQTLAGDRTPVTPEPIRPGAAEAPAAGAEASEHQASLATDTGPQAAAPPLERRLRQWPDWRLPAPLARPGRQAPAWPAWFSGDWWVESETLPADPAERARPNPPWRARFRPDGRGGAVADRAFNALSVGQSLLGDRLLSVQDDPGNPQRQLARLARGQQLETTLIGQRGESPQQNRFLNDELSLQVLHGAGDPRISRIETLGRWQLLPDGGISGEQWQARYGSPADGLAAAALSVEHWQLRLVPVPPESHPATGTAAPASGYR